MNSKSKSILFSIILFSMIMACSQVLYVPTAYDSQRTGVSTDTLVLGRNLYVNNCGSCHNLYQPEKFSSSEWAKVMPEMQKRAKCNDQEKELMMKYLKVRSKQE